MGKRSKGAYIDFMPNSLRDAALKDVTAREVIESMHQTIDTMKGQIIERYAKLPAVLVHGGPHVRLLAEARIAFIEGFFYSCVAMCGITAERILLDLFADTLAAKVGDKLATVPEAARVALENAGAHQILHFLTHVGALDKSVVTPLQELAKLRNKYAHAGGDNAPVDAERALVLLHELLEATVSAYKGLMSRKVVAYARADGRESHEAKKSDKQPGLKTDPDPPSPPQ